MDRDEAVLRPGRRELLRSLAALALIPAACRRAAPAPTGPPPVEVPLARLPLGRRVVLSVHGHPVELIRTASGVTARSLSCTHQGCEVAWEEEERGYRCPCHDGRFDADGNVAAGPPPRPLPSVPARVDGALVLVGA